MLRIKHEVRHRPLDQAVAMHRSSISAYYCIACVLTEHEMAAETFVSDINFQRARAEQ
jgi:hypothetical protein